jgi:poly(3-hydroxybutyrate) depolymerase/peptidoglycan/LPS O-acetylase OafA/YrhL
VKAAAPALGTSAGAAPARRRHIVAFDLIRLLIIGLVVGVHTLSNGGGTITGPLGAFITVFHTSRELFFLITAFVLVYNYGQRPRIKWLSFWRRRYKLVIPAYVAWTVIYFLADGDSWNATRMLWHDLLTGDARYHLYFLLVTMQVYLLFPLVRWLLRKTTGYHGLLFGVLCVYQLVFTYAVHEHWSAPGFLGTWLHNATAWAPSYALYIAGGALAGWHFERLAAFTRRHFRAAGLVALAGLCAGVGTYCVSVWVLGQNTGTATAVFQPVVVVETLAYGWGLLALGLRWSDAGAPRRRLAAAGADCSFGIYLAHPLVLQGLILLGQHTGALAWVRRAPAVAEIAVLLGICVPVVYGLAWALAWVLRRTPLSLMLTGRSMVRAQRGRRKQPGRLPPESKRVLTGAALLCVFLLGAGLWAARGGGGPAVTWTPPVKLSSSVQHSGPVTLVRSVYQIKVDGTTREWIQLTPGGGLTGSTPIIVMLSGVAETTSKEIVRDHLTGYDAELVYPVSLYESWNAGGCCAKAAKYNVNDVAFMEALVAVVDPGQAHPITLAGYSNGGRLTYRIACTDPGLVDSYVVVKAMPMPGCVVRAPVTILQVDATDDTFVPYQPGDKGEESPPATVEVSRLRSVDKATGAATVVTRGDVKLSTWKGNDGTRVEFAVYSAGGHSFSQPLPDTPSSAAVIWAFVTHTAV